jgi:hypothetical protein
LINLFFAFEACVVDIGLFNFQYEEDENNMFNTKTSMEIFFNVLVVGNFYLFMMIFIPPFAFTIPIFWWQSYEI